MTTILRIENVNGLGMFQSFGFRFLSNSSEFVHRHDSFPSPDEDTLIMRHVRRNEYCAFKSIEQLQKWIAKDELKEFINNGFKVLLIDVSECIIGEHQIVYEKENIIQRKDISELFV